MAKGSLFLLLLFIAPVSLFDPAYCKLNPMHILCVTPEKTPVCKMCNPWPIDDNLRIQILHLHNSWRQNVSVGNETRGKEGMQPPASNMMRMQWDYELAKIAQRKANQCLFQQDCKDCNSVRDGRFKVGQNLALFRTTNRKNFTKTEFFRAIKKWYESEVFYATRYSVEHYRFNPPVQIAQMRLYVILPILDFVLNDNHVLCISPDFGPNCTARTPWYIDDRLRIEILHLHNTWRQNVALESETRGREGTQPPATNMMKMRWDYELAIIAQRKAHQCLFQHDCEGCNSVVDGRFKVGQNLALFRTLNRDKISKMDFLRIMTNWYEREVSYVTRSSVENYR
ncbi:Venom allergen [Armadillidium nasatum]|uniref:Venom allergen n=1 Tax=Armadillidium nasatum TaxID=96803 RepID=A0A5N5T5F7_9CRUS|nr:Venom allergen [Armadillidium nasatum]